MTARADDKIDDLHGVPPAEFTRARDALAAAFRKAGDNARAARVRKLRKPSVAVWAVNRLARDAPEAVARFVEAVERLRRAQLAHAGELPEATATQRRALHDLQRRVAAVLAAGGVRTSPALDRRVSGTLLGAATDRRIRADLQRGRLTEELPPPGLDALLAGGTLRLVPKPASARADETPAPAKAPSTANVPAAKAPAAKPSPPARDATAAHARRAARAAAREARERSRRAARLERAAAARRRAADAAERSARQLRERLLAAEAQAAAKRRVADEAATEASRARGEAHSAADAAKTRGRRQ
ncbi:MAG TPA: hypothetical protein VGL09_10000 [Methylomirabilota bacterium]|jgi:hypothetical protein